MLARISLINSRGEIFSCADDTLKRGGKNKEGKNKRERERGGDEKVNTHAAFQRLIFPRSWKINGKHKGFEWIFDVSPLEKPVSADHSGSSRGGMRDEDEGRDIGARPKCY